MMKLTPLCLILAFTAVARAQPRVFVTSERSSDVSIIDTFAHRVTATIEAGKRPRGIRARPDGKVLYVAVSGSPVAPPGGDVRKMPTDRAADGVAVLDTMTGTLREKIDAGPNPAGVALSKDERLLYVANEGDATVGVIDIATRKVVATVKVAAEPNDIVVSPDGKWIYIACAAANQVSVIDAAKRQPVANVKTGARPRQVAFHPGGARAYVACENGSCVTVVDVSKHAPIKDVRPAEEARPTEEARPAGRSRPATRPRPPEKIRPLGVCVSPDGKRAYVTTGRSSSVIVIDTANEQVVSTIANVGDRPTGIAITPDGRTLYTANGPSNDVAVIDTESLTITTKIPAGDAPYAVAIAETPEE